MNSSKTGRNDPCPCGSGKKFKQCCQAVSAGERSTAPVIDPALRRKLLDAFSAFQRGSIDEASLACNRILQSNPRQPDALHLSGLLAHQRGEHEQALALIDRALTLGVNDSMHSNRGIVLQALGRHREAVTSFNQSLALNPKAAPVFSNLGSALQALDQWEDAKRAFESCLALSPKFIPALNGLGFCLLSMDRHAEAEQVLRLALALEPDYIEALVNLGVSHFGAGKLRASEQAYRQVLAINPDRADVWDRLGVTLSRLNRTSEARAAFDHAHELQPNTIRLLRKTLLLSHVYESLDDMLEQRARFEQGLDMLLSAPGSIDVPNAHAFPPSLFNLAYHGHDLLPTMRKVAQMYEQFCPQLRYRAAHLDQPRPGGRLRLAFFSAHVHDHPVAHCFARLIKDLAASELFDVTVISTRALRTDAADSPYRGFSGQFVQVPSGALEAREAIAELELDVLVFQDIGMDDVSYFLGFARLARKQCVLGGHPVTTGLPNMDVYLSTVHGEPEGAQAFYSERLVALDPGTAAYDRPQLPAKFKQREELGLPTDGALYVCPMMLQKVHPQFDAALEAILLKDPHGHVVFFNHPNSGWEQDLSRRLDRTIAPAVRGRILFLPWIGNKDDFASLNAAASIVLDPFHFGIGSTAITTFSVATPVVTWPGAFLRGRGALVYCRLLEIPECVASDSLDFVERAVRIANDHTLRRSISDRIRAHDKRFFASEAYVASMTNYFNGLAAELSGVAEPEAASHGG